MHRIFSPSSDKLVSAGNMEGHAEQQHLFQSWEFRPWLIQCERVSLGNVQDFQAVQSDGCGTLHYAGLPAVPRAGFTGQPDLRFVGCVQQCCDVF